MGRSPCCDKTKVKKGPWSAEEDTLLINFVARYGNGGNWISLPKKAGLNRCGKSCRLRYLNYLRPDIKRGDFTEEEDYVIYTLYNAIGSRWAIIASNLQGRTDNDVKNHWNTKLKKKLVLGKSNNKDTKIPITNNTTENTLNWQTLCNDENIKSSSDLIRSTNNNNNMGEGNEKPTQGYNSSSSCSSATLEISSYSSSSSSYVQDSNGKTSELIAFSGEEDMFWMDLFAASFDDVVVGSQLEEKMSEIASLLVT